MKRTALVLAAACLALAGCGGGDGVAAGASSATESSSRLASEDERRQVAYDACVEAVTEQLKAPATAEFAALEDVEVTEKSAGYTLRGDVDAQNGFGALIRNSYTCDVTVTGMGNAQDVSVYFG